MNRLKIGIIGCGAIANQYLRVLKRRKDTELLAAVDLDVAKAKDVKMRYNFRIHAQNYREVLDELDAAIICLPNYLHAPVSIECLDHGVNVLCEKPMALNSVEANKMLSATDRSGKVLYIANTRRFYWSSREIRKIFVDETLGKALWIKVEEGEEFSWPTESGFFFERDKSGGGVLVDIGSHVVDLILWWLGQYPQTVEYTDDCFGGVEAESNLTMFFSNGLQANVEMSRLRRLRNAFTIQFEGGKLVTRTEDCNAYAISYADSQEKVFKSEVNRPFEHYFEEMINDFIASTSGNAEPFVKPIDVAQSIKVIESSYLNAVRVHLPWLNQNSDRR